MTNQLPVLNTIDDDSFARGMVSDNGVVAEQSRGNDRTSVTSAATLSVGPRFLTSVAPLMVKALPVVAEVGGDKKKAFKASRSVSADPGVGVTEGSAVGDGVGDGDGVGEAVGDGVGEGLGVGDVGGSGVD